MPAIFDLLYREYCRARLTEMRKQLLIAGKSPEVPEADCGAANAVMTAARTDTGQHEIGNDAPN